MLFRSGVHSNYEIDLFQKLIQAAARETGCTDLDNPSLKVIADHIRATAFLVSDGVIPSNEGRGYVQRRIIRRAIRHGYKLGQKKPFFHKLVRDLVQQMGAAYPRLAEQEARITETLKTEEERFFETLAHGMEILDSAISIPTQTSSSKFWQAWNYLPKWRELDKRITLTTDSGTNFSPFSHEADRGKPEKEQCIIIPASGNIHTLKNAHYIYEEHWGKDRQPNGTAIRQWTDPIDQFEIGRAHV